jgi:molecular chaperone GrpE
MSVEPVDTEPTALESLAIEVAQLRDLFARRLFEDRRRQELYDRLYEQLEFARADLVRQFIAPLCRELLLVLDRAAAGRAAGTDPAMLLDSVCDEIAEVLTRRGLRPIEAVGARFDPRLHEAVDQVDAGSAEQHGQVIGQRRGGHLMDGWVLRPAQVVFGHWPEEPPD